jgi:hypothetical protein
MMSPREVLAELDRGNIAVYWMQNGADSPVSGTRIETVGWVSPELRAAADEHTKMLLRIMTRRLGSEGRFLGTPGNEFICGIPGA